MIRSPVRLSLLAVPPLVASVVVLSLGEVGRSVWAMHLASVALLFVLVIALGGVRLGGTLRARTVSYSVYVIALAALAWPLLGDGASPRRWIVTGPVHLYAASLVLPSFLAACASQMGRRDAGEVAACGAAVGAAVLLALHPDVSQALALVVGVGSCVVRGRVRAPLGVTTLASMAALAIFAFTRPDPLRPIPYVEGVFALALERSWILGAVVIAGALVFVVGLLREGSDGRPWHAAVALYYVVLYACSVAGITPAPLIGYGAGPIVGYGLLVAVARWIDRGPKGEALG